MLGILRTVRLKEALYGRDRNEENGESKKKHRFRVTVKNAENPLEKASTIISASFGSVVPSMYIAIRLDDGFFSHRHNRARQCQKANCSTVWLLSPLHCGYCSSMAVVSDTSNGFGGFSHSCSLDRFSDRYTILFHS